MWIRPWGFKEGCLIGAGLLVTGWLLQITIGEIDWSLFACPVNIIVLVLYIAGIVAMHCLRKRVYIFGWMSHYTSAVSSLLWVAGITVVMGLIRQVLPVIRQICLAFHECFRHGLLYCFISG